MHRCERAFGSHHEFDEIEFSVSNEFIQVVSADSTHQLWIPPVDFVLIHSDNVGDSSFETASRDGFFKLHLAKGSSFARRKDDVHFQNMIDRFSVQDGM